MAQRAKAGRNNTYSMELAHMPGADALAGDRGPMLMDESPQPESSTRFRGFQLAQIVETLDHSIPLPQDLRSFAIYFGVLMALAAGMMMHVLLSAQILQAEVELLNKQAHHTVVERQNGELLWLIGRATNLALVQERARAAGYTPIDQRQFVEVDGDDVRIRMIDEDTATALQPPRPALQPSIAAAAGQPLEGTEDGVMPEDSALTETALVADGAKATGMLQQWRAVLGAGDRAAPGQEPAPGVRRANEAQNPPAPVAWVEEFVSYLSELVAGVRSK